MRSLNTQAKTVFAMSLSLLFGAACGTAGITNPTNGGNSDPNYIYGGQSSGGTGTGTVDPSLTAGNQSVAVGFELSNNSAATGEHPASDTNFWLTSARTLAAKVPNSTAGARLVVGTYSTTRGSVQFAFPRPTSTTTKTSSAVSFDNGDSFDALLTALDGINASVVLEAQPGYADLTDLADAMVAAYGAHKSVTGISFDLNYYRAAGSLSDATAQQLVAFVAGKNANLSVELRSSDISEFPSNGITGITYVFDTSNRTTLSSIAAAEKNFAATFVNAPIKFIVGASGQRGAVCAMTSPEIAMLTGALQAGSTVRGIYWSGATVATLSPGTGFACSDTSNSESGDQNGSSSSNNNGNTAGGNGNGQSSANTGNNASTGTGTGTQTGTNAGSTPTTGSTGNGTSGQGATGTGSSGSTGTITGTGNTGSSNTGSTGGSAGTTTGAGSTGSTGTTGASNGTIPASGGTGSGSTGGGSTSTGSTAGGASSTGSSSTGSTPTVGAGLAA